MTKFFSQKNTKLNWDFAMEHPGHFFALGLGSGLSRISPGTAGTLLAWFMFPFLNNYFSAGMWAFMLLVGFVFGSWFCGLTARHLGTEDPSCINWDEMVAFWLILLFIMPATMSEQWIAFLLFRFFDIVKPPPIRYFDQRLKGGFGIMFDDIIAAFFTLLVIAFFY